MKEQAKVIIIGGGITGCSIAWHLAKRGWTDVLLLEKGELTSGTTFHSVGLVSQFRTSPALMQLMNYSIGLYDQFKAEGANGIGWHKVGSLRLASSPDRLKALQRQVSRARGIGLDVGTISAKEALDIVPSAMTGLADRMERAGLVKRRRDGEDGRSQRLHLTSAGQELGKRAATRTRVINNRLMDGFSEAEIDVVSRWLASLQEKFPKDKDG